MIVTIAEHSVDLSLLDFAKVTRGCNVLDLGCSGFIFTNEMKRLGYNVFSVDIAELDNKEYHQYAIVGREGVNIVEIDYSKDPQATRIGKRINDDAFGLSNSCSACTIKEFGEIVSGVPFYDLIKIDIEGSEYEVIMSLTEPPSKQLSIEFHLHTGIYGDAQVKEMEDKLLSLGYFPVKHEKTKEHGLGYNYWDSLWILK